MKALSIRQPWAHLIVSGLKPVENRTWPTKFRGSFLVHASKGMTNAEYNDCKDLCDSIGVHLPERHMLDFGGIVGQAEIYNCVEECDSPFFFGPFGFLIAKANRLPFIPLKGKLGFFNVADTEMVLRQHG